VVVHAAGAGVHHRGLVGLAEDGIVGPQRGAEEADAAEHDRVDVEEVDQGRDPDTEERSDRSDRRDRASVAELEPASATIVSISLAATATHRCDARNNCEGLMSTMIWSDARGDRHEGSVIDVYLPPR